MAVYLARALRLKVTVATHFHDVSSSQKKAVQEGRGCRDHEGLLARRGSARAPRSRGDAWPSYLVKALHLTATGGPPLQGRPKHPSVRVGHRPTREGRAGGHVREPPSSARTGRSPEPRPPGSSQGSWRGPPSRRRPRHRATPAAARRSRPKRSRWTRRVPTTWSARAPRRAARARRSWPRSRRAGSSRSTAARTR